MAIMANPKVVMVRTVKVIEAYQLNAILKVLGFSIGYAYPLR